VFKNWLHHSWSIFRGTQGLLWSIHNVEANFLFNYEHVAYEWTKFFIVITKEKIWFFFNVGSFFENHVVGFFFKLFVLFGLVFFFLAFSAIEINLKAVDELSQRKWSSTNSTVTQPAKTYTILWVKVKIVFHLKIASMKTFFFPNLKKDHQLVLE